MPSPRGGSASSDTGNVRRIAVESVVDQVTNEIRHSIVTGALRPGTPFSILRLAKSLGVSHIPVREALRRLEGDGLIEARPGRSAMVRRLNVSDLQAIYRVRQQIEPALAAMAAPQATDEQVAELHRLLGTFKLGADEVDEDGEWKAHFDFHFVILRSAASEWDMRILTQLWNANERYARIVLGPRTDIALQDHLYQAHFELVEAFESRRGPRLRKAVKEHLERNEADIIAHINDGSVDLNVINSDPVTPAV